MASFALSPRIILEGAKNIHHNKFVPRVSGYRMKSEGKTQASQCYRVKAEGDPITDFEPRRFSGFSPVVIEIPFSTHNLLAFVNSSCYNSSKVCYY